MYRNPYRYVERLREHDRLRLFLEEVCEAIHWSHVPYDNPEAVAEWVRLLQEATDRQAAADLATEED